MLRLLLTLSVFSVLGLAVPSSAGILPALHADFNADTVGAEPDASLPGDPVGDKILYWRSAGSSTVSSGSGEMNDQPLRIDKPSGGGITRFVIVPELQTCEAYVLRWTAMIEDTQAATNFTLRDTDYVSMAVLGFQGNRLWAGSPQSPVFPDMGVASAYGKAFHFELSLNAVADTYSLSVNGAPVPEVQNFPAYGANLDRIEVAFGGTSEQYIYVDDISISADCSFVDAEATSWGRLKTRF